MIHIQGNGEFIAEDLVLRGDFFITIAIGTRVRAIQDNEGVVFTYETLDSPSWYWSYEVDGGSEIRLVKVSADP